MPLLPSEPCLYPDQLFTGKGAPAGGSWWVVHARARAEKALARKMHEQQHPFFLPLYQKRWRKGGRGFCSYLPLFSGYLFVVGDEGVRGDLFMTNQVVNVLTVPDQARLHADLARVYRLMQGEASLAPEECLLPGEPVVITNGPLTGLEGTFLRRGKVHRLFVEVAFLGRAASVELHEAMVARVE